MNETREDWNSIQNYKNSPRASHICWFKLNNNSVLVLYDRSNNLQSMSFFFISVFVFSLLKISHIFRVKFLNKWVSSFKIYRSTQRRSLYFKITIVNTRREFVQLQTRQRINLFFRPRRTHFKQSLRFSFFFAVRISRKCESPSLHFTYQNMSETFVRQPVGRFSVDSTDESTKLCT